MFIFKCNEFYSLGAGEIESNVTTKFKFIYVKLWLEIIRTAWDRFGKPDKKFKLIIIKKLQ